MQRFLMIGEVLRPQGVRGEAKLRSWAADDDMFLEWDTLYFRRGESESYEPVKMRCSRVNDGFAYVTFEGCASPEDVERLRGRKVYIDREHAAPLPEGSVYIADLIGCKAVDETGREIGTFTDVLQNGPTDVYVLRAPNGTGLMAPALKDAFVDLDVGAGVVRVNRKRLREIAVEYDL